MPLGLTQEVSIQYMLNTKEPANYKLQPTGVKLLYIILVFDVQGANVHFS